MPWRPIGLWDVEDPTFCVESRLTDGGKLSPTRWPPFNPLGRFLVLISVRGWVDPRAIVRLEGLGKLKKSTSSGLDPTTFRLVALCLNQLRYRVPPIHQLAVAANLGNTFRVLFGKEMTSSGLGLGKAGDMSRSLNVPYSRRAGRTPLLCTLTQWLHKLALTMVIYCTERMTKLHLLSHLQINNWIFAFIMLNTFKQFTDSSNCRKFACQSLSILVSKFD
jgi:hypothetical protein